MICERTSNKIKLSFKMLSKITIVKNIMAHRYKWHKKSHSLFLKTLLAEIGVLSLHFRFWTSLPVSLPVWRLFLRLFASLQQFERVLREHVAQPRHRRRQRRQVPAQIHKDARCYPRDTIQCCPLV